MHVRSGGSRFISPQKNSGVTHAAPETPETVAPDSSALWDLLTLLQLQTPELLTSEMALEAR